MESFISTLLFYAVFAQILVLIVTSVLITAMTMMVMVLLVVGLRSRDHVECLAPMLEMFDSINCDTPFINEKVIDIVWHIN